MSNACDNFTAKNKHELPERKWARVSGGTTFLISRVADQFKNIPHLHL